MGRAESYGDGAGRTDFIQKLYMYFYTETIII